MPTTKRLVGANGDQIKIGCTIFMNLTMADATSSLMVYLTPQVTYLLFSQQMCKELCAVRLDFPVQAIAMTRIQPTDVKSNDDHVQECPNTQEHILAENSTPTHTEDVKKNKANSQVNHPNETASAPMFVTKNKDQQETLHNRPRQKLIDKQTGEQECQQKKNKQTKMFDNGIPKTDHPEQDGPMTKKAPHQPTNDKIIATKVAAMKNAIRSTQHPDLHKHRDQRATKAARIRTAMR